MMIDGEAVRLPGTYLAQQLKLIKLPIIVGAPQGPGKYGTKWEDPSMPAAMTLIDQLKNEPYYRQIRAVDVSGRDDMGRLRLSLRTDMGSGDLGPARGHGTTPGTGNRFEEADAHGSVPPQGFDRCWRSDGGSIWPRPVHPPR
ncbi:MAG: hypothetical protein HC898_00480 [Phycisphaerales bacterium]|nr:hypothetical protein [Phycisphaerales bacterium]